ncbi:hypothetical protein ACFFHC_03395 [Kytococcus schroeteri]
MLSSIVFMATAGSDCDHQIDCEDFDDGFGVGLTVEEAEALADAVPPRGAPPAPGKPPKLYYEYVVFPSCGQPPGPWDGYDCGQTHHGCAGTPSGGLLYMVSQRVMRTEGDSEVEPWSHLDDTCFPEAVPGRSGEVADKRIAKAFKVTKFALPVPTWDPPRTDPLVNKPVYFTTTFAKAGYEPNETRTIPPSQMLGHDLKILPELKNVTYHFGDGDQHGPTVDTGGEYPDGNITHTYTKAGTLHPRITATYTDRYSLDNGPWRPLGIEVTVKGDPATLTPTTLVTELVPNP